jgi:thymidylate kinase
LAKVRKKAIARSGNEKVDVCGTMFGPGFGGCVDGVRGRRTAHHAQLATLMAGQRGGKLLVEFVGLPGAGKTTVAGHFPKDWLQRGQVMGARVPVSWRLGLCRASWRFFLSLRPRHGNGMRKLWRLADQLIYYTNDLGRPLVLDQGVVQKIWSILVSRQDFDRRELERIVLFLAPVAPQFIVWIKTPVEDAVQRIAARTHGRSRFDGRPSDDIRDELSREARNFELLTELFSRLARTQVIEISGSDAPEAMAAEVLQRVARAVAGSESLRESA